MADPRVYRPNEVGKIADVINKYVDECDAKGEAPNFARAALKCGVNRNTLRDWRDTNKHPVMTEVLDKLDAVQNATLQEGGLSGKFNPTITRLLLSANHGISERVLQQQDVTLSYKHDPEAAAKALLEAE